MPNTFVVKRYSLAQCAYVDSKNVPLRLIEHFSPPERFPKCLGDPSKPPKDGSAPILSLPTELRLQIYDYLTNDDVVHVDDFKRALNTFNVPLRQTTTFAYLYRSPGRMTRPHAISQQVIISFHICRLMREELIDACFSDRTFVLEASIYRRDAGGLLVLPPNPGPTAWIKRLVLLTAVEGNGSVKGIGDLRPLQRMTNLKVLYVAFRITSVKNSNCKLDALERPDNVLKAVLECVPKNTEVHFELDASIKQQLFAQFRDLQNYDTSLQDMNEDTKANVKALLDDVAASNDRKGRLSGSLINHSLCEYPVCLEELDCVNSQCVLTGTRRLAEPLMPSQIKEKRSSDEWETEALHALGIRDSSHTATPPAEWSLFQRLTRWTGMGHPFDYF
jgi:hypothetical protein